MAISFTDRVKVPEEILISGLQGESVILNLNSERYFGLDEVGTRFLTLLNDGRSIQEAYHTLLKEYEVEPNVLRQDLLGLLNDLIEQGLVEVVVE